MSFKHIAGDFLLVNLKDTIPSHNIVKKFLPAPQLRNAAPEDLVTNDEYGCITAGCKLLFTDFV